MPFVCTSVNAEGQAPKCYTKKFTEIQTENKYKLAFQSDEGKWYFICGGEGDACPEKTVIYASAESGYYVCEGNGWQKVELSKLKGHYDDIRDCQSCDDNGNTYSQHDETYEFHYRNTDRKCPNDNLQVGDNDTTSDVCKKTRSQPKEGGGISKKCEVGCSAEILKTLHAKEGKIDNDCICVATKCIDDWGFDENHICVNKDGVADYDCADKGKECSAEILKALHAKEGKIDDCICVATKCIDDWDFDENHICVKKETSGGGNIHNLLGGLGGGKDSGGDSGNEDAQKKYEEARANEQSLANRTLTAASSAATGLGAMEAASALAEQNADKKAEEDMRAYLATFRCDYGGGKQVKFGEEYTLPGGDELVDYYTEYKDIADRLKETKAALGLRSGIESETLYDRAESPLYKYSSVGKTSGAFASLSRAMIDEESWDAEQINADKEKTAKKLKGGLVAAGAGVVGGVAGNMLMNGSKNSAGTNWSSTGEDDDEKNEKSEVIQGMSALGKFF